MKETLTRVLSGLVYIALLIFATSFSETTFLLLFGFFLLVCVYEFSILTNIPKTLPLIFASVSYLFFIFAPLGAQFEAVINTILVVTTILINIRCINFLYNRTKTTVRPLLAYLFLAGYIVIPFILLQKIPIVRGEFVPMVIIGIFILIWTNDTFAYIIGKSIGKTKLFERISPNKTVEGFIGGLVFTMLAGILLTEFYFLQERSTWLITAIIISIFGTLGDLIESKFKRMAGVKDSGTIMPGHGGILDRLDSIIFAAPIIFLFYQITNYVS